MRGICFRFQTVWEHFLREETNKSIFVEWISESNLIENRENLKEECKKKEKCTWGINRVVLNAATTVELSLH